MLFIIGLGNPGDQYSGTRHNIGRMVVERLGIKGDVSFSLVNQAYQGVGLIGARQVQLVLPQSWMNQTGVVVADLVRRFEISLSDLIVVYDDLDLGFGTLRIKTQGGAGGHNGIRSILSNLVSDQFCRLKVGIGHPLPGMDTADYVLSRFSPTEAASLDALLFRAVDALETLVIHGSAAAMNQFNVHQKSEENI